MTNYFETTCQFEQLQETGNVKKITEHLLFEAINFADAEYRLTQHLSDLGIDDYYVKDIKRKPIDAIYENSSADRWYDVKVIFITIDEKSGKEKKSCGYYFVHADSSEAAQSSIRENFKEVLQDWEIHTIKESNIVDVFI